MSTQNEESLATRFLQKSGAYRDGRYRLRIDQLTWLIDHCTRIGASRLELLRGLQAALPESDDGDSMSEFKQLLTNLIIMQTRLADRGASLHDSLKWLVDDSGLVDVVLDDELLKGTIQRIVDAPTQIQSVSSGEA